MENNNSNNNDRAFSGFAEMCVFGDDSMRGRQGGEICPIHITYVYAIHRPMIRND